jgi:GNAT superfamily N-acetyltransferase
LLGLCFEEEGWSAALVGVLEDPASRRRFLRDSSIDNLDAFAAHEGALVVDAWGVDRPDRPQNASPLGDSPHANRAQQTPRPEPESGPGPGSDSPHTNRPQGAGAPGAISQAGSAQTVSLQSSGSRAIDPAFDNLPAGTALFDTASLFTPTDYTAIWEHAMERGCGTLNVAEAHRVRERSHQLEPLEDDSWRIQAFPDGYGYIAAICVNPHYRGSGVLGALFDPIIARAEGLRIPLCLETYAERSMNIYTHKGFELINVTTNEELKLTQYCMARIPE